MGTAGFHAKEINQLRMITGKKLRYVIVFMLLKREFCLFIFPSTLINLGT